MKSYIGLYNFYNFLQPLAIRLLSINDIQPIYKIAVSLKHDTPVKMANLPVLSVSAVGKSLVLEQSLLIQLKYNTTVPYKILELFQY